MFTKQEIVILSLGIKDSIRPRVTVREMLDAMRSYASHGEIVGKTARDNDIFEGFAWLPRASLVAVSCMHGIPVARTRALMKHDIMQHIAVGACVAAEHVEDIGCVDLRARHISASGVISKSTHYLTSLEIYLMSLLLAWRPKWSK